MMASLVSGSGAADQLQHHLQWPLALLMSSFKCVCCCDKWMCEAEGGKKMNCHGDGNDISQETPWYQEYMKSLINMRSRVCMCESAFSEGW